MIKIDIRLMGDDWIRVEFKEPILYAVFNDINTWCRAQEDSSRYCTKSRFTGEFFSPYIAIGVNFYFESDEMATWFKLRWMEYI